MALAMGKPFLRKGMEIKMREICGGMKSRKDFVHEAQEQYRGVFTCSNQEVDVLNA